MIKILNTWQSSKGELKYFNVEKPIYEIGNYKIFKQLNNCFLHTYKDISINQLMKPNKEHLNNLFSNSEPVEEKKKYVYNRALEQIKKGTNLKAKTR